MGVSNVAAFIRVSESGIVDYCFNSLVRTGNTNSGVTVLKDLLLNRMVGAACT